MCKKIKVGGAGGIEGGRDTADRRRRPSVIEKYMGKERGEFFSSLPSFE